MELNDLLVSYKQVLTPKFILKSQIIENLPTNKFLRMLEFVLTKKEKLNLKKESIKQELNNEIPETIVANKTNINTKNLNLLYDNYLNYNLFQTLFNDYLNNRNDINDLDKQMLKDILTPIAAMESGFTLGIKNPNSSATGYFLFIDNTRLNYSKASRDEFISNPNKQFDAAISYYNDIWNMLKPYENKMKERKITPLLAVYGMWWRPVSMINYLKTGKDNYISPSDNLTLIDILNKAKKWNV